MRVARGRARFEARDSPASGQLKRSPAVGSSLLAEGSALCAIGRLLLIRHGLLALHPLRLALPSFLLALLT